jgi:hypothetical protein
MTDSGHRWTIRGIEPDLIEQVIGHAKGHRLTVGEVVTTALQATLDGGHVSDNRSRGVDVVARLTAIEAHLARMGAAPVKPASDDTAMLTKCVMAVARDYLKPDCGKDPVFYCHRDAARGYPVMGWDGGAGDPVGGILRSVVNRVIEVFREEVGYINVARVALKLRPAIRTIIEDRWRKLDEAEAVAKEQGKRERKARKGNPVDRKPAQPSTASQGPRPVPISSVGYSPMVKPDEAEVEALMERIRQGEELEPIVMDKNATGMGILTEGRARLEAYRRLGRDTILGVWA